MPEMAERSYSSRAVSDTDRYIGSQLQSRRTALGLTRQDLSERIGISPQQLQKYEAGQNRISAGRLLELAQALESNVSFFFPVTEEKRAREAPPQRSTRLSRADAAQFAEALSGAKGIRTRRVMLGLARSIRRKSRD